MELLISLGGMVTLIGIAVLLSNNRKAIRLRTVLGAFGLQAGLAATVLYIPIGQDILAGAAQGVQRIMEYSEVGINFLFGSLSNKETMGFVFVIQVLCTLIFFSSLMSVLYYLGVMKIVINGIGGLIARGLGTTRAESMSAASNIFVGHTEAPLVIRPFIAQLSRSELFAVMSGGCASVAGAVMVGYASMGVELKYLVAASFMAAPGGLLMAKIIMPETEPVPEGDLNELEFDQSDRPVNIFDAAASGALSGVKIAASVGSMLLAFIALIAMLNGILGGVGGWFGLESLSIQGILGFLLAPLAFILGTPWSDANAVAGLIGQKFILNEFVAYVDFVGIKDTLTDRGQIIATFALCGFANLSSIAMMLGGLGTIAPQRRHEMAQFGLKAVLAGTLSNFMSATMAGFFLVLA